MPKKTSRIEGLDDLKDLEDGSKKYTRMLLALDGQDVNTNQSMFLPEDYGERRMHGSKESAQFALDNPEIDRWWQKLQYDIDQLFNNA